MPGMKEGPNIASIAALVGDPARANMLTALLAGQALTATELAHEAGVTLQTTSSHLSKMMQGGLLAIEKQGRHRYYRLGGNDVAEMIEAITGVAARAGHLRTRVGPKEPALRHARVCYDHLAGDMGVALLDGMLGRKLMATRGETLLLTGKGERLMQDFGIELDALRRNKRPLCRPCLDWSVRRHHLAGALGKALLDRFFALKWARHERGTRLVIFSPRGEAEFAALFGPSRARLR
jgi:DNA-binding transcriptional ArsR family regulator